MVIEYSKSVGVLATLLLGLSGSNASAQTPSQKQFANKVQGSWCGPGEIVAGKYKDTRFTCNFSLETQSRNTIMHLSGACQVGVFKRPMTGKIALNGGSARGTFFGDSPENRLDITAGKFSAREAELAIERANINGTISFSIGGADTLTSTVSVRAGLEMIPVINMQFKKCTSKN